MNVIIAGSTGMIGNLVLTNCLGSERITRVVSLVRKPTGLTHKKLVEIVITDFEDLSSQIHLFEGMNAGFFCLGIYTGQVPDELFKKITVQYAVEFAKMLNLKSPNSTLCLLSGAGADRNEKSRTSFARYKGMAENQIAKMNLDFYSFRPAYIYPVSPRNEPNIGYRILKALYPIIKLFGNNYSIKSTDLAYAMFQVGLNGADKQILENNDIMKYNIYNQRN